MCSAVQSNDEHFLLTISICGKARRQQWQGYQAMPNCNSHICAKQQRQLSKHSLHLPAPSSCHPA